MRNQEFGCLDLADFGGVAFSEENVIDTGNKQGGNYAG